jgi:hypothetical protein
MRIKNIFLSRFLVQPPSETQPISIPIENYFSCPKEYCEKLEVNVQKKG